MHTENLVPNCCPAFAQKHYFGSILPYYYSDPLFPNIKPWEVLTCCTRSMAPTWWLNVASWLSCLSQSGDTRPWGCPSTGEVGVSEGWCVLLAWLSPQEQAATSPQTAWVVAAAAGEVLTQYRLPWGAHFWLQVRNRLLFQNTDSSPPTLHCPGGCQGQPGRRCTAPVSN